MNNLHMIKKSMIVILTLVVLLSLVAPVRAQKNEAATGKNRLIAAASQRGPTDPAELEAFLDELMAKDMEEHHIPGAAVSVVKDGKLFFAKGYGYADLENKIPLHAEQTIFPTGSVGKLFTWKAVMQLVEQGKLDLGLDRPFGLWIGANDELKDPDKVLAFADLVRPAFPDSESSSIPGAKHLSVLLNAHEIIGNWMARHRQKKKIIKTE